MSRTTEQLAQRRQQLLLESAAIREDFSAQGQMLRRSLATIDTGISVFNRIKRQPALMAGIVFGVVLLKPQRLLKNAQTAFMMWNNVQRLLPIVQPLLTAAWQRWRMPSKKL